MSQAVNDVDALNGHFKKVYADNIKDLRPDAVKMMNFVDFNTKKKLGDEFQMPLSLGYESGFSYGGTAGDAFALNNAVAASRATAKIQGHELVLRSFLSIAAASRSVEGNSQSAFVQETKHIVENMFKSYMHRMEIQMMYGQSGIGKVESISDNVVDIEPEEWAPGIWAGSEKQQIEIYSAAGVLRGKASIDSVDFDANQVTVDLAPAGVVPTDVIYHAGAKDKEFTGLHKILANKTGTLFSVDASKFSLYQGNTVEVGSDFAGNEAVLNFDKVEEAISKMMEKGYSEQEAICLVNPRSWKNLLTEQAAKRQYDSSFSSSELENGSKAIKFWAETGSIAIVSSIYVKEGFAYVFSAKQFSRIGSTDVTFEQPGLEGKFVKLLESVNAYEMRLYSDQALFADAPGQTALLTFIKS